MAVREPSFLALRSTGPRAGVGSRRPSSSSRSESSPSPAWLALSPHTTWIPRHGFAFGRFPASREFVERDFDDPVLTGDYGHDGRQFYVLAATFPHFDDAQGNVDRLRYRARRILLPAVVSPVPRGAPLIWSIFAVNLAAVGLAR